jgi:hypothetical protein
VAVVASGSMNRSLGLLAVMSQAPEPEPTTIRTPESATILTSVSAIMPKPEPAPANKRGKSTRKPKKKIQRRKVEEQKKEKKKAETHKGKRTGGNKNLQQDDRQDLPEVGSTRRLTRQSRAETAIAAVFYELDQRGKVRQA